MNKSRKDISAALALWEDTEAQMASLSSNQRAILNQMTDENLFGNGAGGANNTLEVEKDTFVNVDDGTASSTAKSGGQKSSKLKSNKSDSVKTHDSNNHHSPSKQVGIPTKARAGFYLKGWFL